MAQGFSSTADYYNRISTFNSWAEDAYVLLEDAYDTNGQGTVYKYLSSIYEKNRRRLIKVRYYVIMKIRLLLCFYKRTIKSLKEPRRYKSWKQKR